MARSLSQLEFLHIESCDTMEQVFWNEIKGITTASIEFPKLNYLTLKDLPNLEAFCQGVETIHFPKLTAMIIEKLPKLNSEPPHDDDSSFHFLCNQKVTIPEGSSNLWKTPNQNVSPCNLTSIHISYCSNLRYLFSVSMARSLSQLKELEIENCGTMEQVFWNEIKSITTASIEFPKLKYLTLKDLPNLEAFCQGVESIQFPKLKGMKIGKLPKLNSLTPLNSEPPHDDSSFHFLCNQKVDIANLKILALDNLKDNISNIWCHQIPISFYSNLERLHISILNGIRNLMSSSIAKNLVSLNYLSIESCQEMVEVIEADEKEIVDLSLFPTLKRLDISNLLKLRSFCQWKHGFELPLLKHVEIENCHVMESFTLGSLSTQNIKQFTINGKKIDDTKDLNAAIHHFRTKSQDEDEGMDLKLLFEEKEEKEEEDVEEE